MRKLTLFTHCAILATVPSLLALPEYPFLHINPQTMNWWIGQAETEEWIRPATYDDILKMLEDLESGELERKWSFEQLVHINEYLATLANEGILPNELEEAECLEKDTYDLMYGENNPFQLEELAWSTCIQQIHIFQ